MIGDIFLFSLTPVKSSVDVSEYHAMGERGTVNKVIALVLVNIVSSIAFLVYLTRENPYIDIGDWGDPVSPVLLFFTSFLVFTVAQFLCFRIISGKGNLVTHAYLSALSTANYVLFTILAVIILLVTRIRGIDNLILIIGGLYLLFASFVAFQVIYETSVSRTIAGFVLAGIVTVPLFFLFSFPFAILGSVGKTELYDWRLTLLLTTLLFLNFSILVYMGQQQKLIKQYPESVPLLEPLKVMAKTKWIPVILFIIIAAFLLLLFLDKRYPSIKTSLPPFLLSFAPDYDPDLLYIGTRNDEFRGPTYVSILKLSENKIIEELTFSMRIARMRPDESGLNLILSNRQSPHGAARVLSLSSLQSSSGRFEYLESYGIRNHQRNETYYTLSFGGVRIVRDNDNNIEKTILIEDNQRYYSVAIHPNDEIIYLLGDNFIDIVNINTLEIIDTIKLGGKLRDVIVSPDGELLYVADALWNRIRLIPTQNAE